CCPVIGRLSDTWCFRADAATFPRVPRRAPKEKARAVSAHGTTRPTAPFPSFPLREWRFGSFPALILGKREFWFGSFDKPLQISAMFVNDEQGCGQRSNRNRYRRCVARSPKRINQERHRGSCGDRTERNVAPKHNYEQKQKECPDACERR